MEFKKIFVFFSLFIVPLYIKSSSSLVTPAELASTHNGRITQKEILLLNNLSAAINNKNYNQAYTILDDLYTFVKARSDLFISEIPLIVNPVGQQISRMIQVTRSNQIDSILTLTDKIERIVQSPKDLYHKIMRDYHNQPKGQQTQQAQATDRYQEAEQIYSNIIVPSDRIQGVLTKVERLFILAHLRNYYFLTTKTGAFGSERSNITGQQYNPNIPLTSQQSSASKNPHDGMYP